MCTDVLHPQWAKGISPGPTEGERANRVQDAHPVPPQKEVKATTWPPRQRGASERSQAQEATQ